MKDYFGVKPINSEQKELFKLLKDDKKQVISVTGKAGTGKTLILGAYMLDMLTTGHYNKIVISKPMEIVGRSKYFGTVPGGAEEKFDPFLLNFKYLAEKLMGPTGASMWDMFVKKGDIKFVPIELMRGVSFPPKTLVYLDECQNIDNHMINTLGTRMESETRLLLSGDLNQIDITSPKFESGLKTLVNNDKYLNSDITGHVHLMQVERGPIAHLFSEIFEAE